MKRALLIFAKQPVPGRVKTRLSPPLSLFQAAELYRCMLSDVLDRCALVRGVDRFIFFQPDEGADCFFRTFCPGIAAFPQEGEGLGERLERAFASVFAMGFCAVACMGSDSPDLPRWYVEDAFRLLEEGRAEVIFGPVEDGGYCLIAATRHYPGLFRDIPWSTGEVLEKSERQARALGLRTLRLPVWHDVDTAEDLERMLRNGEQDAAERTAGFLRQLRKRGVI